LYLFWGNDINSSALKSRGKLWDAEENWEIISLDQTLLG